MSVSKRSRIYTEEDLAAHKSPTSCWISRGGKVYDVTTFLADHPGGEELILDHAGQAVDEVMANPDEHDHSDSAYEILGEYVIGRLVHGENTVRDGALLVRVWLDSRIKCLSDWEATDDFHPDDTNLAEDFERNQFLDLRRPLLRQVWEGNFRSVCPRSILQTTMY